MQQQAFGVAADLPHRLGSAHAQSEAVLQGAGAGRRVLERLADPAQRNAVDAEQLTRLQGDQPFEQRRRVVLVGEHRAGSARARDVARDLQREGGLAQTLRAAEQAQLAGPDAAAEIGVEQRESGRPRPGRRPPPDGEQAVGLPHDLGEGSQLLAHEPIEPSARKPDRIVACSADQCRGNGRMWQITQVARLRPRLTSIYWPLLARACLIALCGLITTLAHGPQVAIAPALLLLLVAALGTLPVPHTVPAWLQPLTEALAAALVVGALHGSADLFLPYILLPIATAGIAAGLGAALVAAGLASLTLVLTSLSGDPSGHDLLNLSAGDARGVPPWTWVLIFMAVAVVSAWMKRVSIGQSSSPEPAYADAHRPLSALHVVARQLSLGLDPPTLAAALVDELHGLVAGAEPTVLVKSGSSRFVPLVGDVPTLFAESVMLDAWVGSETIRRTRHGVTVAA